MKNTSKDKKPSGTTAQFIKLYKYAKQYHIKARLTEDFAGIKKGKLVKFSNVFPAGVNLNGREYEPKALQKAARKFMRSKKKLKIKHVKGKSISVKEALRGWAKHVGVKIKI